MKRFLTSLLAVLYLSLSCGTAVRAHYCMGRVIGVSLAHAAEDGSKHSCGLCGMEKSSGDGGCCHDEEAIWQAGDEQAGIPAWVLSPQPLAAADLPPAIWQPAAYRHLVLSERHQLFRYSPPPRPPAVPIWLRVRAFLI